MSASAAAADLPLNQWADRRVNDSEIYRVKEGSQGAEEVGKKDSETFLG